MQQSNVNSDALPAGSRLNKECAHRETVSFAAVHGWNRDLKYGPTTFTARFSPHRAVAIDSDHCFIYFAPNLHRVFWAASTFKSHPLLDGQAGRIVSHILISEA